MKKVIILSLVATTALTACTSSEDNQKQSYIDATVEVACMDDITDFTNPETQKKAEDIWIKNGFKVSEIASITKKYINDKEINDEINKGTRKCAKIEIPEETVK